MDIKGKILLIFLWSEVLFDCFSKIYLSFGTQLQK